MWFKIYENCEQGRYECLNNSKKKRTSLMDVVNLLLILNPTIHWEKIAISLSNIHWTVEVKYCFIAAALLLHYVVCCSQIDECNFRIRRIYALRIKAL